MGKINVLYEIERRLEEWRDTKRIREIRKRWDEFEHSKNGRRVKRAFRGIDKLLRLLCEFWGPKVDFRDLMLAALSFLVIVEAAVRFGDSSLAAVSEHYITYALGFAALGYPSWVVARLMLPVIQFFFMVKPSENLVISVYGGLITNTYFVYFFLSTFPISLKLVKDARMLLMAT